jgi:hypothetical protein
MGVVCLFSQQQQQQLQLWAVCCRMYDVRIVAG